MKSVKWNVIYNFIYQFLMLCFPLILTPYISRVLGAIGIGLYSFNYSIAYCFVIFAGLGLKNYGVRVISSSNIGDKTKLSFAFWETYVVQLVGAVIITLFYLLYCFFVSKNIQISLLFGMYVLSSAFDITWFFAGIEEFKIILTRNLLIKIITTILLFLFVKSELDIKNYVLIMNAGTLVSQISLWHYLPQYINIQKVSILAAYKNHFIENVKLFIPVIAVSLYKYMDKIMLGTISSTIELGYYENVERIVNIPVAFVTALGTVMLSRITNLYVIGEDKKSKTYLKNAITFTVFLASAMIFGIMGIAREFVPTFFGAGFEKCILLIYIMVPTVLFLGISNVIRTQYLIPLKLDNIYIISVCIGAIVNVVLNLIFIPKYAAFGAAIGTFFAELSVFLYQYIKVYKEIKITRTLCESSVYLFIGCTMWIILYNVPTITNILWKNLIYKILLGGSIYCGLSIIYLLIFRKNFLFDILKFKNRH